MEFNELIQSFAAKFGLESIDIEDGSAALEIDGMAFGFFYESDDETLTVAADLGQQSINADGSFGSMMLKANFLFKATKGATLFQNPENDAFGLQQRYRLVDLDVESLSAQVEKLANLAEEWKAILAGAVSAEEQLSEDDEEEDETVDSFNSGGFLRV